MHFGELRHWTSQLPSQEAPTTPRKTGGTQYPKLETFLDHYGDNSTEVIRQGGLGLRAPHRALVPGHPSFRITNMTQVSEAGWSPTMEANASPIEVHPSLWDQ